MSILSSSIQNDETRIEQHLIRLSAFLISDITLLSPIDFHRCNALEKTRLFLIRAIWNVTLKYELSHHTAFSAVRYFNYILSEYSKVVDIEGKFEGASNVRDLIWLCAMASIRIAIKSEEKPDVAWEVLGNATALLEILPILKGRYNMSEIVKFEERVNAMLLDFAHCPSAIEYLEIICNVMPLGDSHSVKSVSELVSYASALMTFSKNTYKASSIAHAATIFAINAIHNEGKGAMAREFLEQLFGDSPSHELLVEMRKLLSKRPVEASVLTKDRSTIRGRSKRLFYVPPSYEVFLSPDLN